jgi:hypothetical protein
MRPEQSFHGDRKFHTRAGLGCEQVLEDLSLAASILHYKDICLNSATGYITPKDILAGHQQEIQADRDRKLEAMRE